jgi:hypothetical protein
MSLLPVVLAVALFSGQELSASRPGWWDAKVEVPAFTAPGPVAKKANGEASIMARRTFDRFMADARRDMPELKAQQTSAQYDLLATATKAHYWEVYAYYAGAHGTTNYQVVNYALLGGKVRKLRLADLFVRGVDARAQASTSLLAQLMRSKDLPSWIEDGQWTGLSKQEAESFVVSREGLIFLFGSYALGSYAEGTWRIVVPYNTLAGLDRGFVARLLK